MGCHLRERVVINSMLNSVKFDADRRKVCEYRACVAATASETVMCIYWSACMHVFVRISRYFFVCQGVSTHISLGA